MSLLTNSNNNTQSPSKNLHQSHLHFSSEIFENFSLHINDVEFLHNAFIVQSLVAPLVRFSNKGRYEPYVAKKWQQQDNIWQFTLHEGLSCEDGQEINSDSFRKSLIRSLQMSTYEEILQTPFGALKGIQSLLQENQKPDIGIYATSPLTLEFHFSRPTGKSFLEYLAMTPFAFLCDANFNDGKWIGNIDQMTGMLLSWS